MATVGSFNVALTASTGRFVGSMSRAERQWERFTRSVQRQAKQLPKVFQAPLPASMALARTVVRVGAVAGAMATAVGIWGVRLAAQFEQTQIAMATMLGSAEEADQFLRQLEKTARRTPFGFQQLVEMSRQMLAWGFARQEIEQMLDPIGDFVAAMGAGPESMDRIIRALGQIRARGKLSAQEMLQLTRAGVPAWELLAKTIGTSIPEAMERVSKGTVPSVIAVQAIIQGLAEDPRFAGAMERQSRTILGQWQQVKDGITTIVRGIGQDIIRVANLAGAMQRLNVVVGRFADLVSEKGFLNALREAFPPWLPPVILGVAGAIAGALVPAIVALLLPALRKLRASIAATGMSLGKWMLAGAAVAVVAYLLARYWGHLGDVARAVWSAIGAVALYGASLVVRGVGLILAGVSLIVPAFRGAAQSVLGLADSLKAAASSSWASARSSMAAANAAAKSQSGMAENGEWAAQTQHNLAAGMESAAQAAKANLQSFDEVHQIQEEMAESPAMDLELAMADMPALPAMPAVDLGAAVGEQLAKVTSAASEAWTRLSQAMEPVNRAVQWIRDNWPTIGPIIEGIASIIMVLLVPALVKSGVEAMIAAGQHVAAWVMQGVAALTHGAKMVGQLILIVAEWAGAGIKVLAHAGQMVLAWAMQGWEAVKSVAIQVGQFVILAAKWVWMGILAGVEAAKIVAAWLVQQVQAIASVAVQIAQFVILGAQWVWMGVTAMANAAVMAAAWLIAIWPIAFVVAAVIGLAYVIWRNWEDIKAWTIETWSAVCGWLSERWDAITTWARERWAAIRTAIFVPMQAVSGWLSERWAAVRDTLGGIWNGVKNLASEKWNAVRDTVRGVLNYIIGLINRFIRFWNSISFTVPSVTIPFLGTFGGWTIGVPRIPEIPMLALGGRILGAGLALVGEAGPELLHLPRGAQVAPLSASDDLADTVAQAVYSAIRDAFQIERARGGAGDRELILQIDGQRIARVLVPAIRREEQRTGIQTLRPQEV